MKIYAWKQHDKNVFSKQFGILEASGCLDCAKRVVWHHFTSLVKSAAASVVQQNAATLFYCEAAELLVDHDSSPDFI